MTLMLDFALPAVGRACRECGSPVIKKMGPGRWPAFCSDECRDEEPMRRRLAREANRPAREATPRGSSAACWICGKPMISHGAERSTCKRCRQERGAGVCSNCGGPKRTLKPGMCRRCIPARPKAAPGVCKLCAEPYVPRAGARPDQQFCSKSCTRAWQNGARPPYERQVVTGMARKVALARTRRLRHAQTWDGITDEEILERDGWRCQVPGCKRRPIRSDVKYPHPRSKSIDHIVPLSLGGDDTAVNKRAAHLGCNMARGNQMADEQMALFGSIREPPLATVTAGERAVMFQRRKRVCACGTVPLKGSKFCQACLDQREADAEDRRALELTCRVRYYTCRYCKELKVERAGKGWPREVCPERRCQLARLAANNLRLRQGMTAEEADALVIEQVAADGGPGYGRWQRGGARRAC